MSEDTNVDRFIKETSILEEYNINWTQKLGAGISGPVRVCVKKSTQERFALKILIDRPKARNEVRLHMMCASHPNIVKIIEVYANSVQFPHETSPRARLLIVMEMMEGGELFHRISQHKHFTEKMASQVTKQISLALQNCHSLNIAHRDLKPENLLFKDNSLDAPVKLCDFGFAKIDQGDLMTPQFTPYYVAPQVLEAQRRHQKEKSGIIPTSPTPYTYNKAVVAGIQQAHAEQLANMRIQDLNMSLKPLNSVNNPILRKRKLLGTKPSDELFINDPENEAEDTNVGLEKLRDVIAQCILPQAGDNEDEKLNEVTYEAWRFNRDCKLLRDGLQGLSWDGRTFSDKVDRLKLAEIVKQAIEEKTNLQDSQ
ncbi:MAP kinase-activated protein kinase 5 isoform X3 [Myxocyprinus asiaticus]|uniref:MAP kinase-activated protein kinase 5 isoform X3 n=1 Tax=Myxocyprinus asiaticus TaxID=70543 RepID=UPI002222D4D4|nr:MAP kinase-activated protein kinase 5 isoform X3 [Myxocyprinus asiaticus]